MKQERRKEKEKEEKSKNEKARARNRKQGFRYWPRLSGQIEVMHIFWEREPKERKEEEEEEYGGGYTLLNIFKKSFPK